jgi:hypothetical protein
MCCFTQSIHTLRLSVGGQTHARTEYIYSIFRGAAAASTPLATAATIGDDRGGGGQQ